MQYQWQTIGKGYDLCYEVYNIDGMGIAAAVYQSGEQWFFCLYNELDADGCLIDSFNTQGGAYATPEHAMQAAELWWKTE